MSSTTDLDGIKAERKKKTPTTTITSTRSSFLLLLSFFLSTSSSPLVKKQLMNQVDADALRVGLGDGSAELREVLLDAEALDEMLVRIQVLFFLFSPLLSKLLSSERRKRKK